MTPPLCELCGKRDARYVCQNCGRLICDLCVASDDPLCSECFSSMGGRERLEPTQLDRHFSLLNPFSILFLGIFLIFIGFFLIMLSSVLSGTIEGVGAVVMIGPIPIIVSSGGFLLETLILAIILTLLAIVLFLISRKRSGSLPSF